MRIPWSLSQEIKVVVGEEVCLIVGNLFDNIKGALLFHNSLYSACQTKIEFLEDFLLLVVLLTCVLFELAYANPRKILFSSPALCNYLQSTFVNLGIRGISNY